METPIQQIQFDGLLDLDDAEARQELEPETLENISHDFVRQKLQAISREMDALCCRAMTEADHFMAANEAAEKGEKSTLRCRVRRKESTLEISWERQFYFERKSMPDKDSKAPFFIKQSSDGKKRIYGLKSKHIRKGMSDRYTRKSLTFETEPEWATEAADQMEEKFEIIRRQVRQLGQIRKTLYTYDRLSKKFFDLTIGEEDNPKRMKPVVATEKADAADESEES